MTVNWDIAQFPEPPKWTVKICPHGCRFRANATSTKAALEALIDHIEFKERPVEPEPVAG